MVGVAARSEVDTSRISPESSVRFVAGYMGMRMAGRFTRVDGIVRFDPDRPERSSVEAVIDADSVEPAMAALAPVLRSQPALDTAAHREIRFESRRIRRLDGPSGPALPGHRYAIQGEVVIKGERQPLLLEATLQEADEDGSIRVTATGSAKGLIADETIEIQLEIATRAASTAAAPHGPSQAAAAPDAARPQAAEVGEPEPAAPEPRELTERASPMSGPIVRAASLAPRPSRARSPRGAAGEKVRILGMSGSLRRGSLNRSLLDAAIEIAPPAIVITRFGLHHVPLYDGDVEAEGDPPAVARLKKAIREHDGLLIATPEYNHSIPAVTKNAIDWASRPPLDPPLRGKPVALMGASPGRSGAVRGLEHARVALQAAGAVVIAEEATVPRAVAKFDADRSLIDEQTREAVSSLLEALRTAVLEQRAREAA